VEQKEHHRLRKSVPKSEAYASSRSLAYQEEASKIASVDKHIFEDNQVVVTLTCILLVVELRFDLLELRLDIRVVHGKSPEKHKVSESFVGLAMIDEVAWCLRDKRNHDAHQSTRYNLNALHEVRWCTGVALVHTYSSKLSIVHCHAQRWHNSRG
jgi:hypothetical protein